MERPGEKESFNSKRGHKKKKHFLVETILGGELGRS